MYVYMLMHYKSPYTVTQPAAWMFIFLHMYSMCEAFAQLYSLHFFSLCIGNHQWWSVTKYNYFVTVLKYIFQVSVLYWSTFSLSNFYFYFTTFQSIRSYFLLHYIS